MAKKSTSKYYKAADGQTYVSKEVAKQYGVDTSTGLGGPSAGSSNGNLSFNDGSQLNSSNQVVRNSLAYNPNVDSPERSAALGIPQGRVAGASTGAGGFDTGAAPVAPTGDPTAGGTVTTRPTANPAATGLPIPGSTSTTTATSDPARTMLDKMKADLIKPFNAPTTTFGGQILDERGMLDERRVQLEDRKIAEMARIRADFDAAASAQQSAAKKETGTSSMNLARMGGFDSASGQAVLTNLERVHVEERQALIAKRENAIQMAQQAFEDKDFALAQLQLQEAKEAEQRIYDRQKDFVNLSLQVRGEERADAQFQFQRDQAKRTDQRAALEFAMNYGIEQPFYVVGGVGYDTSTGDPLSYEDYIARGGKEDFSNSYIIQPGTLEDKAFVQNLRDTYPDAGITSKDSAESAQAKLKNSRKYRKETYIAPTGGLTGAQTAAQSNIITEARQKLSEQADGSEDRKANPDTYRDELSRFIQAGGNANDFYRAVSLDQFIAPQNRVGDLTGINADFKNSGVQEQQVQEVTSKYGINSVQDYLKKYQAGEINPVDMPVLDELFGV